MSCTVQLLQGLSDQVEKDVKGATDLPGRLAFTDVAEYSLTDDLSREPLDGALVTMAKR